MKIKFEIIQALLFIALLIINHIYEFNLLDIVINFYILFVFTYQIISLYKSQEKLSKNNLYQLFYKILSYITILFIYYKYPGIDILMMSSFFITLIGFIYYFNQENKLAYITSYLYLKAVVIIYFFMH